MKKLKITVNAYVPVIGLRVIKEEEVRIKLKIILPGSNGLYNLP